MKRSFDGEDLIVATGFLATIAGSCLFYLVSYGIIGPPTTVSAEPVMPQSALEWVQPALGEAIVNRALLEQTAPKQITAAAAYLNRVTMMQYDVDQTPFGYLDTVKALAVQKESDNAARAELFKGRAIVNLTKNGTRHGWLSADQYVNEYNEKKIRQAELGGNRILDEFLADRQSNLGQSIVEASLAHMNMVNGMQEEIGQAIVRVAMAQSSYEEADAALQTQMGASIVAAVHAGRDSGFAGPLVAGGTAPIVAGAVGELRSWPEISFSDVIAASIGLTGLLIAGFLISGRPEPREAADRTRFESVEQWTYRRTG